MTEVTLNRRETLGTLGILSATAFSPSSVLAGAGDQRSSPNDPRLGTPKDLNGYFPFKVPETLAQWKKRRKELRRQLLMAMGRWPEPTFAAVKPVIHGEVKREGYTVSRVYFETSPGLYITGSLYRPTDEKAIAKAANDAGKIPAILCPHGHWSNGRFHDHGNGGIKEQIKVGGETDPVGGRHPLQARCVQLARMGCLVFHYDMMGYADSAPISYQLVHRFAKQRPSLSSPKTWGLFSAQAEMRLLNVLGMQTHNSVRALDWICAREDVDTKRIGVTGASGGGSQTFLLAAIDDRVAAAFPAVMVSTAMQGGCTCENACYLRVGTGNIEIAALCAPRPLAMSAADDWTKELETKGLPELKKLYALYGKEDFVSGKYFPFKHNYNKHSRQMMYHFFAKHFGLKEKKPIIEKKYKPLSRAEMTVWNDAHPKPASTVENELKVLRGWTDEWKARSAGLIPKDRKSLKTFRQIYGGAWESIIGRALPKRNKIQVKTNKDQLVLTNSATKETCNGRFAGDARSALVTLWITEQGHAGLFDGAGNLSPGVAKIVQNKQRVISYDVIHTGDFRPDGKQLIEVPWVKQKKGRERYALSYLVGYNHPVFVQRVHDVLNAIASLDGKVNLVGMGAAAPWAAAAAMIAGTKISKLAVSTDGFRFANITKIRDPQLVPGAIKYGDLPAILGLCAPTPLFVAGEKKSESRLIDAVYSQTPGRGKITRYRGTNTETAIADWIVS